MSELKQPAFMEWQRAGFGPELVRLSPYNAPGLSPGKKPVESDWQAKAVTDAEVQRWAASDGNVGLRTRLYPAIDVDVDDQGVADICERVAAEVLGPTAVRIRKNSARRALLYRLIGSPFGKTALKVCLPTGAAAKVEVLANGQQLVVGGTHHSGAPLEWLSGQPNAEALAPVSEQTRDLFLRRLQEELQRVGCVVSGAAAARPPRTLAPLPAGSWERDEPLITEALSRLDPDLPYEEWVQVGMAICSKDSGSRGLDTWDAWSSRGTKYPGREAVERKWRTFSSDGGVGFGTLLKMANLSGSLRALGGSALRVVPAPQPTEPPPLPEDDDDGSPPELEQVNREHFIIDEGGHHFVAAERYDHIRKRRVLTRYTVGEFKTRYANRFMFPPGAEKPVNVAKVWLSWSKRRQYLNGVVFDPTGSNREGVYNLWRGWPIAPKHGDWSRIREHLYEVLCSGNDYLFEYIMGWLARLVQRPAEPGEVALVFRGLQGAGKSIMGNAVKRMFGQHAMSISSSRALVGQFNAHLRDLCFLLADEALFAGDKATTSTLKALITDPTMFIESKGIDATEARNMLHIMMTTNSDWAVPVALDDRRFAVFDVSPCRIGDREYFSQIADDIQNDAVIAAMLYDLLSASLEGYQVRAIPDTKARAEQASYSLDPAKQWLLHVLTVGDLGIDREQGWRDWATMQELQTSHEQWARNGKHRDAVSPRVLGRTLTSVFGPNTRPRHYGDGNRLRGYRMRSLEEARERFLKATRLPEDVFPGTEDEGPVQSTLDQAN